jgi:hypothetical protein
MPDMHGQYPSWASGKPADRTERERSCSIVMTTSAVIDGRADEWERRAVCVPAKAAARKGKKAMPSEHSPVCRRRYVGKECDVTREIPKCAAYAEPQKTGPIRRSPKWSRAHREVGGAHTTDDAEGQHNLGGGKEPCFSREVFT